MRVIERFQEDHCGVFVYISSLEFFKIFKAFYFSYKLNPKKKERPFPLQQWTVHHWKILVFAKFCISVVCKLLGILMRFFFIAIICLNSEKNQLEFIYVIRLDCCQHIFKGNRNFFHNQTFFSACCLTVLQISFFLCGRFSFHNHS